jgi:hypothetical protein
MISMKQEVAKEIEWPLPWGASTYVPSIIADEGKVLLVFGSKAALPNYNPALLKIIGDANSHEFMAIVEFLGLLDFKFGWIDEDAIRSPHSIEGLKPYRAYEVQNSQWLENLKQVLSTEGKDESQAWDKYRHFVLGFHDSRFECIAKSYYIEAYSSNVEEVFDIAYDRVTGAEWWMKGSRSDFRCPRCAKYLGKHAYAKFCLHCGTQLASPS